MKAPSDGPREAEQNPPESGRPDEDRKRRIEEEMRRAVTEARRDQGGTGDGEKLPSGPKSQQGKETEAAAAILEDVAGEVYVVKGSQREAAQKGAVVLAGAGLAAARADSRARLQYGDGTWVELEGEAEIRELTAAGGKRVFVARGAVRSDVAKQPTGEPMVFATPHGEATVVGTTLRIVVDPDPKKGMRLEVEKGKVRLKRNLDSKTVDVPSGHYAVAAMAVELASKPLQVEEIVLLAKDGKTVGDDWKVVKDETSAIGRVLEAWRTQNAKEGIKRIKSGTAGWVEFSFTADAGKDYLVWVRGCSVTKVNPEEHDSVCLVALDAEWNVTGWDAIEAAFFDGYCRRPGGWWIGGEVTLLIGNTEEKVATVRFRNPGRQRIRLCGVETPMRIDAIWLSATQKTRPEAEQYGPRTSIK